jgi:hypothetical protein
MRRWISISPREQRAVASILRVCVAFVFPSPENGDREYGGLTR